MSPFYMEGDHTGRLIVSLVGKQIIRSRAHSEHGFFVLPLFGDLYFLAKPLRDNADGIGAPDGRPTEFLVEIAF